MKKDKNTSVLLKKENADKRALTYIISAALVVVLFVALALVQKYVSDQSMLITVLKKGIIYSLIAVSMNLLNGFTGLFSLGQAGFMLLGAYTYAILTIPVENRANIYLYYDGGIVQFTIPFMLALVAGGLVAALFAFLIGLPVLKLKSDYLAIATLGFAEIIRTVVQYDKFGPLTNGSNLLRKFPTQSNILFYFAVVGFCIAVIALLIHSTYGRAFKAIRDDEIAAEAMGINLAHHKRLSFVISSFFAGVGGALLAMYQGTIQAQTFKTSLTYEILLIVVIGGIGSLSGSVIGSFLYVACSEWWLRFLDNEHVLKNGTKLPLMRPGFRMVVFSVVIMIIVLFFRKGIMGDKELSVSRIFDAISTKKKKKGENVNG